MLLLCECCNKPIERLDDIKLVHKSGCEIEVLPESSPESELRNSEPTPEPSVDSLIKIFPDGRMNTQNAALYTGYSAQTLYNLRSDGGGPLFVKTGQKVFYYKEDLDAWINKGGKCSSTAQAQFRLKPLKGSI